MNEAQPCPHCGTAGDWRVIQFRRQKRTDTVKRSCVCRACGGRVVFYSDPATRSVVEVRPDWAWRAPVRGRNLATQITHA